MLQIIFYCIVLIISIYQIIQNKIYKKKYELLPFMIATSCLIISREPQTSLEISVSTISSISFIIYMVDFFIFNNLKNILVKKCS